MIGVKELIEQFKQPVDWEAKAKRIAKRDGVSTKDILDEWEKKRLDGIKIHEIIQKSEPEDAIVYERGTGLYSNEEAPELDNKFSLNGTHLERPVSSSKYGVIGYPDKVKVKNGFVSLTDHKSWEKIYRSSSRIAENGFKIPPKKFLPPIDHLDDCNYNEACLQLSLYAYIISENNRNLKIDKLYINHILHANGKIVDQNLIEVPYLRKEVKLLLKTLI